MSILSYHTKGAVAEQTLRKHMTLTGRALNGERLWTADEDDVIRKLEGNLDQITEALPDRTRMAIRRRRIKLGLKSKTQVEWSAEDISKLRKLYPHAPREEICAKFPNRNWGSIKRTASYHGFSRRRRLKPTGIPEMDMVRNRCFEIRWSMQDLDEEAGTGGFFYNHNWTKASERQTFWAFAQAVEALGGRLLIKWEDAEPESSAGSRS